tara:strand:+ start:2175 stop:2372 length:198 start_codon:yes stop_codon:yes gene_type:complete
MKKETRKYIPPYASLTFDEYWLEQDELWDISLNESKRQKEERLKKINEQDAISQEVLQDKRSKKT